MKRIRFQAVIVSMFLLGGLAACGDKPEANFSNEPRGYVEFYLPAAKPGEEDIGVDTQIYRIENNKREFLGMTQKWQGLAEPRRGLTISAPPGEQVFVVVHGSAEAPVAIKVEEGGYHRVRIEMTGLGYQQMIGTTRQLRFGLQATAEPLP